MTRRKFFCGNTTIECSQRGEGQADVPRLHRRKSAENSGGPMRFLYFLLYTLHAGHPGHACLNAAGFHKYSHLLRASPLAKWGSVPAQQVQPTESLPTAEQASVPARTAASARLRRDGTCDSHKASGAPTYLGRTATGLCRSARARSRQGSSNQSVQRSLLEDNAG